MSRWNTDDLTELKSDFDILGQVCYPPADWLRTSFRFETADQFTPGDGLGGNCYLRETITPAEFKFLAHDSRGALLRRGIDVICANGQKWYTSLHEDGLSLWSEDGQKHISIFVGAWSISGNAFLFKERAAVKELLSKCRDGFVSQEEAEKCFPEEVCRGLYDAEPALEVILVKMLPMIEHLRKRVLSHLVSDEMTQVMGEESFQQYLKKNPDVAQNAPKEQVMKFLKSNKNAVYVLGEKYGFITNGAKMIHYQKIRDMIRHPKEFPDLEEYPYVNPRQMHEDFRVALGFAKEPVVHTEEYGDLFDEAYWTMHSIRALVPMSGMISAYADKSKKRNKPDYWQPLIDKGIATEDEIDQTQGWIQDGNRVAHGNVDAKDAEENLSESYFDIDDLNKEMNKRHDRRFKKWLDDHCYDPYSH